MTSFLLHCAEIPTPPAWVCNDRETAIAIAARELEQGHQLVSKPLFGSQGEGVRRHRSLDELETLAESNGIFYLQRFVDCGSVYHDWRVFVIRGKAVAAMRRCGVSWLNNVAQGAHCEPVRLDDDSALRRLAEDAAGVIGMPYAGVDIIRDEKGGYSVIEVNSVPAWKGLQSVSDVVIADRLADDFLSTCVRQPALERAMAR